MQIYSSLLLVDSNISVRHNGETEEKEYAEPIEIRLTRGFVVYLPLKDAERLQALLTSTIQDYRLMLDKIRKDNYVETMSSEG